MQPESYAEFERRMRRRSRRLRAVVFGGALAFAVVSYLLAVLWSH